MSYDGRKRQEKEIRRKDIIDAAERVFFSKGYENASMDEVAKEAEFSKRTVYVYFSSKEQIYFEIMIRGYRLLIEMIENSFHQNPPRTAREELYSIFFTFYNFSQECPEYFRAIMEYETKDPENRTGVKDASRTACYRLGEQIFGYLLHALQRSAAEGTLMSGLDAEKTALILWASTVGVYNTAKKKAEYLRNYHGIESGEFLTESFHWMMLMIGEDGGNQDEKKNGV